MGIYDIKVVFNNTYTIEADDESEAHEQALDEARDDMEMQAQVWTTYKEED